MLRINANIQINGIVQGVGFRPFLHRQMVLFELSGWIRNTSEGVEIEAEGSQENIYAFLHIIRNSAPELSRVDQVILKSTSAPKGLCGIKILPSTFQLRRDTLISPDAAVCSDCLRELFDPGDRRFKYPFINCTNCGPRFSIIRDVPYDRINTTMAEFAMCPNCASEYANIADRRYHAQPDCCPVCGPELFFLDSNGNRVHGDPIFMAGKRLNAGEIIAIKGLSGIHLSCRCDDPSIVNELRRRKLRDEKPLALMCRDLDAARKLCMISNDEEQLLLSCARPIVLLKKREPHSFAHLSMNQYLGIMLPYTPVHHLLMQSAPNCIVMTSANFSDLPIITDNSEALSRLRGIADGFLLNNRNIENRCDDSLMQIFQGKAYPIRRSRGYVPMPLNLKGAATPILACGAEQKASFSINRGDQIFQSAHIGDLKNAETLQHYENQIALFKRLFDVEPELIACDLHPDYLSTDFARKQAEKARIRLMPVQHHHAHMAACMADNELTGRCIGIIWDGTGYGTDGTIWGGEFLIGDYAGFARFASLKPLKLPGSDRAIKEIWRLGISIMQDAGLDPSEFFPSADVRRISAMIKAGLNCPKSSGMGRLFDAACTLAGIRTHASYEGQGAVLLEAAAIENCSEFYPFEFICENELQLFDWRKMVAGICSDRRCGKEPGVIAAKFMNTLVEMARSMCAQIRSECGLNRVVLSGGVFQNMYLLNRLVDGLTEDGFLVYHHSRVSTNDEGVSFGQLAIVERSGGNYVPCGTAENC